jgi:hypothetical protein
MELSRGLQAELDNCAFSRHLHLEIAAFVSQPEEARKKPSQRSPTRVFIHVIISSPFPLVKSRLDTRAGARREEKKKK